MKPDALKISRNHRTATAVIVLCEAGEIDSRQRTCLLKAMWEGWRQVMRIKLGAAIYSEWQELKRRQSE